MQTTGVRSNVGTLSGIVRASSQSVDQTKTNKAAISARNVGLRTSTFTPSVQPLVASSRTSSVHRPSGVRTLASDSNVANVTAGPESSSINAEELARLQEENARLRKAAQDKLKKLAEVEKKRVLDELQGGEEEEEGARNAIMAAKEEERKIREDRINAEINAAKAAAKLEAQKTKEAAEEEAANNLAAKAAAEAAKAVSAVEKVRADAEREAAMLAAAEVGAERAAAMAKQAEAEAKQEAEEAAKIAADAAQKKAEEEAEQIRKIAADASAAARQRADAEAAAAELAKQQDAELKAEVALAAAEAAARIEALKAAEAARLEDDAMKAEAARAAEEAAARIEALKAAEEVANREEEARAAAEHEAAVARAEALAEALLLQQKEEERLAAEEAAAAAAAAEAAAASAAAEAEAEAERFHNSAEQTQRRAARAAAEAGADNEMVQGKGRFFTCPEVPLAGETCVLYFNRAQSDPLRDRPRVLLHMGFNNWEISNMQVDMAPTNLNRAHDADWWSVKVHMPKDAMYMNFVFSDGDSCYDNNGMENYQMPCQLGPTQADWDAGRDERARNAEARMKQEEEERKAAEESARQEAEAAALRMEASDRMNRSRGEAEGVAGWAPPLLERNGRTVFICDPAVLEAGKPGTIKYNKAYTPVGFCEELTLHWGHNKFALDSDPVPMVPASGMPADEVNQWFEATIDVPASALCVDFVVSDKEGVTWDNNDMGDFHAKVMPSADPWSTAEEDAYQILAVRKARVQAEEAERTAKRLARKKEKLAMSREVLRRQMRHVFYTEPGEVRAGEEISLFYNPSNTNLAHSPTSVYVRGGYNRWNPDLPAFGPLKMTPGGEPGYLTCQVQVPEEAFMMDFVFSDCADDAGTFDNNSGTDYHSLVEGDAMAPPLNVVHISVEMAPICKVGGLGDVVTALSRAVSEAGHNVEIVIPAYEFLRQSPLLGAREYEMNFDWGGCGHVVTTCIVEDIRVFFIEPTSGIFNTGSVYGRNDDGARFEFFCNAALEFLLQSGRNPDIIHCHDWSTAPAAGQYWSNYHSNGLWKPKIIFTIHNLEFGQAKIADAAYNSQKLTTVSRTYRDEIAEHPSVSAQGDKFVGVRNGIDQDIWNPETDIFLPIKYSPETAAAGKAAAKRALRERFGLRGDIDTPVVGVVSRLTAQKGIHLIKHAAFRTVDRGGQFVLLGSAPDPKIQGDFNALASSMGGDMAGFCFEYDEPLSHLMYAGCDFILVPSMFEPCGLTQMIAMSYGAIPVVRSTGGLHDTVFDVDHDQARGAWEVFGSIDYEADGVDATNGFSFWGTDDGGLDSALNRAIDRYWGPNGQDRSFIHDMYRRNMLQDWSWNRPALDYIELYFAALRS